MSKRTVEHAGVRVARGWVGVRSESVEGYNREVINYCLFNLRYSYCSCSDREFNCL